MDNAPNICHSPHILQLIKEHPPQCVRSSDSSKLLPIRCCWSTRHNCQALGSVGILIGDAAAVCGLNSGTRSGRSSSLRLMLLPDLSWMRTGIGAAGRGSQGSVTPLQMYALTAHKGTEFGEVMKGGAVVGRRTLSPGGNSGILPGESGSGAVIGLLVLQELFKGIYLSADQAYMVLLS